MCLLLYENNNMIIYLYPVRPIERRNLLSEEPQQ